MLGAILGDIAATNYETYNGIADSMPSILGMDTESLEDVALNAAKWAIKARPGDCLDPALVVSHHPLRHRARLIQCATLAWIGTNTVDAPQNNHDLFYDDKEGFYSLWTIVELIQALKNGSTKIEALNGHHGKTFKMLKSSWPWKTEQADDGLFTYLMRAWDCFEQGWDFTSCVINAAKSPYADRHLLCCLTGALAEAMYGCEFMFSKRSWDDATRAIIPDEPAGIPELGDILNYQIKHRVFFPKNSALTNVEKHTWTPYNSRFNGKVVDKNFRDRILKAFYTGWDNRYGFYLDNGWIYTYRSDCLIGRLHIKANGDTFVLADFQCSEEKPHLADTAVECGLNTVYSFLSGYYTD